MKATRRTILAAGGALLATPRIAPGLAQTARYPERPIEITVGFVAGGATDLDARLFGQHLERRLGGSVVVINRAGAGGEVALGAVARARPDGHSLATTNMPGFLTIPIERQAQYKLDDFVGIGNLVVDPCAVTVHAQ
ncbi:MAG TPA: tripartite tricarboxylate transporter substrate-binding protein, partial [Roseomonas sp.]